MLRTWAFRNYFRTCAGIAAHESQPSTVGPRPCTMWAPSAPNRQRKRFKTSGWHQVYICKVPGIPRRSAYPAAPRSPRGLVARRQYHPLSVHRDLGFVFAGLRKSGQVRVRAHQWELQQSVHPFSRQRRRQGTEASVVAAGKSERGQLECLNPQGTSCGQNARSEFGLVPGTLTATYGFLRMRVPSRAVEMLLTDAADVTRRPPGTLLRAV
jgi:hypothetical protein